jgi:hypothetical protein
MSSMRPKYSVYDSAVIDAPIDEVWREVRDMMKLLPICFGNTISDVRWVDGGDAEKIPSRFEFKLQPGGQRLDEEVVARSETEYSLTYRQHGAELNITEYVATYRLKPITNEPGKTFLEWSRDFAVTDDGNPAETVPFLRGLTAKEVDAVKKHFARP